MTSSTDPAVLEAGYARCRAITREHGTTYYWGARLLPRADRRHVYAVYALARLADDIVDVAAQRPDTTADDTAGALDRFEQAAWAAITSGTSDDPVLAAVATTVRDRGIPDEAVDRFFGAMRADLTQSTYQTWDDLLDYMDGSAAVIGEMMLPILRPSDATAALEPARALGQAFQLTNFLRDVDEDLDRGRVYLPQEDLRAFGADPALRAATPQWRELMAFQIRRNRRLYRLADTGLTGLPGAARRCVATARVLYARILDLIEDAEYDVFTQRLRVPTTAKAALAARMVTSRDPLRIVAADRAAADPHAGAWVADDDVVLVDEDGAATGRAPKSRIHHDDTPLHLGFSCYLFDEDDRLLVTTRARSKPSFPGVLTNSACGHPGPGEPLVEAARRRVGSELGLQPRDLRLVLPDFAYRARQDGLVEHELCPVLVGRVDEAQLSPDPAEVDAVQWVPWSDFAADVSSGRVTVSPWCARQVEQLAALGERPADWPTGEVADLPAALRATI